MAVVSVLLASIGGYVRRGYAQQAALASLRGKGAMIVLTAFLCKPTPEALTRYAEEAKWAAWFGNDFVYRIGGVALYEDSVVQDGDLACLKDLPHLHFVDLANPALTNHSLNTLRGLRIKKLYLEGRAFSDEGLDALLSMASLERLILNDTSLTADGVVLLEGHGIDVSLQGGRSIQPWESAY